MKVGDVVLAWEGASSEEVDQQGTEPGKERRVEKWEKKLRP